MRKVIVLAVVVYFAWMLCLGSICLGEDYQRTMQVANAADEYAKATLERVRGGGSALPPQPATWSLPDDANNEHWEAPPHPDDTEIVNYPKPTKKQLEADQKGQGQERTPIDLDPRSSFQTPNSNSGENCPGGSCPGGSCSSTPRDLSTALDLRRDSETEAKIRFCLPRLVARLREDPKFLTDVMVWLETR